MMEVPVMALESSGHVLTTVPHQQHQQQYTATFKGDFCSISCPLKKFWEVNCKFFLYPLSTVGFESFILPS